MTDRYLNVCPYCNGTLTIEVFQGNCKPICVTNAPLSRGRLYYSVCKSCGSVVRSYMEPNKKQVEKADEALQFAERHHGA